MNATKTNMIDKISNDLHNPKCEGFFLEVDGNEMTVRRINGKQFEITTESWRGNVNTYYQVNAAYVEQMVEEWLMVDDHCTYTPHYPISKWSESEVERFMTKLCPKMCDPLFKGFTLSAEDAETYIVQKHPNGMDWKVDGKVTDFCGVLCKTKAKLAENHMWKFEAL